MISKEIAVIVMSGIIAGVLSGLIILVGQNITNIFQKNHDKKEGLKLLVTILFSLAFMLLYMLEIIILTD